jgi:pilus assembly protein CpaC
MKASFPLRALHAGLAATVLALTLAAPAVATAQAMDSESAVTRVINVPKDKSLSFRLDTPATKIVIAQPDIAEIVATTDRSFYVRGVDFGSTNLLVYGPGGRLLQVIDVRVGFDAQSLQQDLRAAFPREAIEVRNLGEGLLLTGEVSNTGVAARALAIAEKFAPSAVTSSLSVRASQQVILEVRVLEATRSALQDAGISVSAINGHFNLATPGAIPGTPGGINVGSAGGLIGSSPANGVFEIIGGHGNITTDVKLQALEQKGVIRTLARPNLVAVSGEKASFLAGGEFPYPVPNGQNGVGIEFREYGVKLNFKPEVQDNGLIRMLVAPEVSQLDYTNSVRIAGFDIPGLTERKSSTTVEMRSGTSFAIAGMFQHNVSNSVSQTPGLGSIPVLGALFRSARWQRNETELIIVVTPRLAVPGDLTGPPPESLPGREPSALGMFLTGQLNEGLPVRDTEPTGKK